MLDKKKKIWVSDCNSPELEQLCKKPENAEKPEVRFLKASDMLSKIKDGSDVALAVAAMESLAKEEYPEAMFAMGDMFAYGCGVHKDRKTALSWYKKAADASYKPAQQLLKEKRKQKIIATASAVFGTLLVAGIVVAIILAASKVDIPGEVKRIIKVHDDTQLSEVTTVDEFVSEVQGLIAQYDDELVISGQVSTNRVVLKFEGNELDLSDFLADKVVVRENNLVIIQFANEEEAQRCLDELMKQDNIIFAEMDEYSGGFEVIDERYCDLTPVKSTDFTRDYMSWGVADMGLDKLSEHVTANYSDEQIVVAVIDSGALVHSENSHRYIEGYNVVTGGAVVPDHHGTHVAGTILDGARNDNVFVWNLDVFNGRTNCSNTDVYNAFQLAIENGVDVINMSLRYDCNELYHQGVRELYAAGVVFVKSAGNSTMDTADCVSCPAEMSEPIVVGAYDINHEICYFSNYGTSVDVCAPGAEIWSYSHEQDGCVVMFDGTSMATPHIAALAALIKCIMPEATPAQVEMYIKDYCRPFTNKTAYASGLYGAGAPDATAFIEDK